MNTAFRPHDLLWLRDPGALRGPLPGWVRAAWPVVVRRAEAAQPGLVAVGLRGSSRAERHASWVARDAVLRALSPETLAQGVRAGGERPAHPVLDTLHRLVPPLDEIGLAWGPAGSTAFALATGAAILHANSDLDLVLRAAVAPSALQRRRLQALQGGVACRLDIQIETGAGAFALNEWLAGRGRVLLKTDRGPVLVADPWAYRNERGEAA
ncbi:malonate decarboxylase holo-ACP synthase [Aromatoleum petrolei]|uniref:Malonate decarboxylase holo-ACP synthase n=1 Tax=Aromatoleum petrolei TaxID=76116 RepID=A0ABX1MS62_9RHOO|nr:malonate decarboxylase holo-ACP synthase [Aromatoleum petrolei]NMF87942.1 malonate decarboxylase holo-ACP synthase [Aromatoleum petrolei]QTQ36690.1 Phosphoribosyl-dephospho-CoA transferase [Aromatoleum petrolei]